MSKTNVAEREVRTAGKTHPKIKLDMWFIRTEIPQFAWKARASGPITNLKCFKEACRPLQRDWDEGVGVIEDVHAGSSFRKGDRVVVFQVVPMRLVSLLPQRTFSDLLRNQYRPRAGMEPGEPGIQDWNESESGGWAMARYRIAPLANLYKILDALDFRHAAPPMFHSVWAGQLGGLCRRYGPAVWASSRWDISSSALHRNAKVIALIRNPRCRGLLEKMGVAFISPNDEDWWRKDRHSPMKGRG